VESDPRSPLQLERGSLDDGTELVRQPTPAGSESFSLTYLAPAGWGYDGRKRGLALLASELVVTGGGKRDRAELARELDRHGATLTSEVHPESAEVTLWGPAEHFVPLLPLLADSVLRPRWDPGEVGRLRRRVAERQMRERSQPDQCAEKALYRRIFSEGHPYRETGLGTPRTVPSITRPDLERFHRRHYTCRGTMVATCREPLPRLEKLLSAAFRGHDSVPAPTSPKIPPPVRPSPEVTRLMVPGGSQVELRVGGASIPRADPGYPAAFLANELLGGRSILSRVFQSLREKRGLVYHASSELEAMLWGGYWVVEAGTRPSQVEEAQKLLLAEIGAVAEEAPPTSELDRIRESAIGSTWLELETTATAHEIAVDAAYHHLPEDFYRTWPTRLRAVTPRQVAEGARQAIDLTRSAVVVAGPLGANSVG
jgi:zinc protease